MKAELAGVQKRLQAGCRFIDAHPRWVESANFHLTLVFLGDVEESRIGTIADAVDSVAAFVNPFELSMERIELFPPKSKQPKVISAGVRGDVKALQRVHEMLSRTLYEDGFDLEDRPYAPHLTLARLTSVKTASRVGPLVASHANVLHTKFQVEEIVLFESVPEPEGTSYVPLHVGRLTGSRL